MPLDFLTSGRQIERSDMPDGGRYIRKDIKRRTIEAMKRERLADAVPGLPEPGESWHIVSNGRYDFWTFIPVIVERIGGHAGIFYGSTWTMNRGNVVDLFRLMDDGQIDQVRILTGTYFKRRESSVYAKLVTGLHERGGLVVAFENHTKIALIEGGGRSIVVEGSANFTANPRVEQYTMCDDPELLAFHREWMDRMIGGDDAEKAKTRRRRPRR